MSGWLHAVRRFLDRDPYMIAGYASYGGSQRILVRGRAMENEGVTPAGDRDSIWQNLVNSYRRIEADPLAHAVVRVTVAGATAEITADDEGFFSQWVELPEPVSAPDGWVPIGLELISPTSGASTVTAQSSALLAPPSARFITISDMDDTVLQSHVTSIVQALRTVILGNARTRLPFPGVAAFYRALHAGVGGNEQNPIFYVSSSPWNLYDLLIDFLDHQGIPEGPLTLRDWDLDRSALGSGRLHNFKDAAIRDIMATYPHLPVILIGDSSQQDPEIYRNVVREFPERVLAIYIRDVKRTAERRAAIASLVTEVAAAKSVLVLAEDTLAAARHAAERGYIDPTSLAEIGGEKQMDEAATPGKTGRPVVKADEPKAAPIVVDEREKPPPKA